MEKKLLKKLGNYFSKGVKVGALTAAVLMGAGCGNLMDDAKDSGSQGNNYQEEQNPGNNELDSYIFLRHRFVEENATIPSGSDARIAWSNKHFTDARSYMLQKVADFKHRVCDLEPDGNFLETICNEVFVDANGMPYDGYGSLDMDINLQQNDLNYGNILGAIAAKTTASTGNDIDYEVMETCYSMLAHRSYNDSLGYLKDSQNLPFNQEKASIENDLQRLNIAKDYNNVESRLNNLLQTAAARSGVSVGTLQEAVNLSLLNAGLWGARDLAASAGFQLSNRNTLRVPSNQIDKLNRDDLVHNMSASWVHYYERTNAQEQEQGKGL